MTNAKGDQIVCVAQIFAVLYYVGHSLFVGKEVMSYSSNSPSSFSRCQLGIAFVVLLMKIKGLCSTAAACFASVQSAPGTQKMR